MKIIDDSRKRELYRILEKLYNLAEEGNVEEFKKLNESSCTPLMELIFGDFKKGEEGWEWDQTRNLISAKCTMLRIIKLRPEKSSKYKKEVDKMRLDILKRFEEVKKYLI